MHVSCIIKWPQSEGSSSDDSYEFILYSFSFGFAVPLSLIMIFYYLVIRKLKTLGLKTKSKEKRHRKVTNLVLTIITCYIVSWSPYWIMQIFLITTPPEHCKTKVEIVIFVLVGCLAYSNSSVNPVLYAFLSENFKKSFIKVFSCAASTELNVRPSSNSVFLSRFSRSRNSEKRFASMVTKVNRIEKLNENEMASVSTALIRETDTVSPYNGKKVLQTDL